MEHAGKERLHCVTCETPRTQSEFTRYLNEGKEVHHQLGRVGVDEYHANAEPYELVVLSG